MLEKGIYFSGDGTNVAVLIEMFVCTIFGSICCCFDQFHFDSNCLKSFSFLKKFHIHVKEDTIVQYLTKWIEIISENYCLQKFKFSCNDFF